MASSPRPPRGAATPGQATLTFLAAAAAMLGIGIFIARVGLPIEAAILLAPGASLLVALAAIRVFRLDPFRTLLLQPASGADLLLAIPLALALFVVSDQLAALGLRFWPVDEAMVESLARMVRAESVFGWLIRLAGIGFGAALAEEILFRGVILTGFGSFGRLSAILVSAILFTLMHGLFLPNYLLGGLVLGLAAMATGSILVPIAIHLLHNVAALVLYNVGGVETLADPLWVPAGILAPAVAILGIAFVIYVRRLMAPAEPATVRRYWGTTPAPKPPPTAAVLARDLEDVPIGRQRFGFLALAGSVAGGTVVILVLFAALGYLANPGPQRAAAIESLRQITHEALAPGAAARAGEVDAAYRTLSDLNREGRFRLSHVARAARLVAVATADGEFSGADVDTLLAAVGAMRQEGQPP